MKRTRLCLIMVSAVACGSSSAAPQGNGNDGSVARMDAGSTSKHDGGTTASDGNVTSHPDGSRITGALLTCSSAAATIPPDAGTAPGVISGMVPGPGTFVDGCQIFPANNAWNVDVSSSSLPTTTAYSGIPQGTPLHPDLGGWTSSGPYGIPYNAVPNAQPLASITFTTYASQSDPGPNGWSDGTAPTGAMGATAYPIPDLAKIEGAPAVGQTNGDDHLLVLEQGATCGQPCTLWETWSTVGGTAPPWSAANGARWNLASNGLRPAGYTSGDAAGLSVFAGLLKISEVESGTVSHAIRVTLSNVQYGYVLPAGHCVGTKGDPTLPPMGLRMRMMASFDTSSFSGPGKIVATAMKTYGLIVADIGSDWFFQGDSDNGWDAMDPNGNDTYVGELLTDFKKVTGASFEVIDTGSVRTDGC